MIDFLAENAQYKVYALAENVYLKTKTQASNLSEYEAADAWIAYHYGDPTSALLLGSYIIVAGRGLTICDIDTKQSRESLSDNWTNALHRDELDEPLDFRYVAYTKNNKLRVFKMNVLTLQVSLIE